MDHPPITFLMVRPLLNNTQWINLIKKSSSTTKIATHVLYESKSHDFTQVAWVHNSDQTKSFCLMMTLKNYSF